MTDFSALLHQLDLWRDGGRIADFWLRDDDAVLSSPALDRLTTLGLRFDVPLTLAVIPQGTGPDLARWLDRQGTVEVAVHGWAHLNHAAPGKKSQELGLDRPAATVLGELADGLQKLRRLHGDRLVPVLVPPWNRIDAGLIPHLADLGYRGLSTYGKSPPDPPLPILNSHVDVMDWRGHRGGRDGAALVAEMVARLQQMAAMGGHLGLLTHHLVHDPVVWAFLEALFDTTRHHPGCRWQPVSALLMQAQTSVT